MGVLSLCSGGLMVSMIAHGLMQEAENQQVHFCCNRSR